MKAVKRDAREMKDSGIEWIGKIPHDWKVNVLVQVSSQVKNKNIGQKEQNLLLLSYGEIKRKDINSNEGLLPASFENYNIVEKDDIVLRLTDLQNDHKSLRVGRVKERGIITSAYVTLHPNKFIKSEYLYYVLNTFDLKKGLYGMGAGVRQGLIYDEIKVLKASYPPLLSQKDIADYLDDRCAKIDAIIAEAKASIEEYKELKQAVITNAVTKGLNKKAELKNSHRMWIGEIPVHWDVAELKFFASIKAGITLGKKYPAGAKLIEMPYLRVANVQGDYVDLSDVKTITVLPEEVEKYRLEPEVVLMTEGGDRDKLARGCVWHGEIDPCLHQNHVFALTPDQEKLNPDFFSYVTTSDVARVYFDYTAKKTTNLANTNATTIMNFRLAIPPLKEQKEIVEYLDSYTRDFDELISEKQSLIEDLEAYKKSLIYEVVTGKRKVVAG